MAGAEGLFADYSIDLEIADPPGGPENIKRVASGERDFCLTSVHHYLTAWADAGPLAARFAAIVVQRSPVSAIVLDASPITEPADLAGARLGGSADGTFTREFLASLEQRGVGAPVLVPLTGDEIHAALVAGEIDAYVEYIDALPRQRRLVGAPLRAVPVGLGVYASGLVAADRLSDETVARMRGALVDSIKRQREDPEAGVAEQGRRYPAIDPVQATEGWKLIEPFVFAAGEPGVMNAATWDETLDFLTAIRGLPRPPTEMVYRPELATADLSS